MLCPSAPVAPSEALFAKVANVGEIIVPMSKPLVIVGLGEVVWDVFGDEKALGGAPINSAYHVNCLSHTGLALTRVGNDELGDEAIAAFQSLGMCTDYVQRDPDHPTGWVNVELDSNGIPDFTIIEHVAYDFMELDESWIEQGRRADAICFGTLAQRSPQSRQTIQRVLEAAESACHVYDVNFRQSFYWLDLVGESLARTDVLKLNEEEVQKMQELFGTGGEPADFIRQLMKDCSIDLTCVTRGDKGCTLYRGDESVSRVPPRTHVVDTVGSGDAFTAGLMVKYLEGRPLEAIADAANLLGAHVAGRRGATPEPSAETIEKFNAL